MESDELAEIEKVDSADVRSFWTMVLLTVQNAFNDKAAQLFLILLGVQLAMTHEDALKIAPTLSMIILLPFILFSPLAGWISDRYSKTWVLRGGALLQMLVLGLIVWALSQRLFTLAIVGFGLLALQSTLLSPAKKGIIKEMMGSERLGFASGVMEVTAVLAICAGQIVSGFWFNSRFRSAESVWEAVYWPLVLLFICSIPAFLLSFTIKYYPSPSKRPFKMSVLWEHIGQMKDVVGDSKLRLSALAIAFFWFVGGFINIVALQVGGTGGVMSFGKDLAILLAYASGGMILGGAVASLSSRRSIELGLVPIGGLLMVVGCIGTAYVHTTSHWFGPWLGFTGFGAAIFLVPLNAHLQDVLDEKKRGKVLAGANLLDGLAGASAVGLQYGLTKMGLSIEQQFIVLAVLCLGVTIYALKLLPQHFVRFTLLTVLRVFYRQKVMHAERLPKDGGVLIVPNHVSYIDAFILTSASRRPIRFLMYDSYFKKSGVLRWFVKFFDTVPISERRAKQAIQLAADAVQAGGVVCIFPEGQLTRTGCMNEIKRGFEMIARKAKCPVVPVYMDGLWGSIFSFEREKFLKKRPYRLPYGVTVVWGEPIPYQEATAVAVRRELSLLNAEAFSQRDLLKDPAGIISKGKVRLCHGAVAVLESLRQSALAEDEKTRFHRVYNALQISDLHAICRGDVIAFRVDELGDLVATLALVLPIVDRLGVVLLDGSESADELKRLHQQFQIKSYFGKEALNEQIKAAGIENTELYVLDGNDVGNGRFPVRTWHGIVVAMSMRHPAIVTSTNVFQAGWKEGAWGRVLPGHFVDPGNGPSTIYLCDSKTETYQGNVDAEGFLLR